MLKDILTQHGPILILSALPISYFLLILVPKIFAKYDPNLGAATVICTNITGTLTEDKLMVRTVLYDQFKLTQEEGKNFFKIENIDTKEELLVEKNGISKDQNIQLIATTINLCRYEKVKGLEQHIIHFFTLCGVNKHKIHNDHEIIQILPTDSEKKTSTVVTIKRDTQEIFGFSKGNPFKILDQCSKIRIDDKNIELTHPRKRKIRKYINKLNKNGQKVLGFAYKPLPLKRLDVYQENFVEKEMVFLGLIGVTEPLNLDLQESIEQAHEAGIKTYILSKEQEKKAVAIGRLLNIINPQYFEAISGPYLEQLSDQKLEKMFENKEKDYVFCELKEQDKERVVKILKRQGETIAIANKKTNIGYKEVVEGIFRGRTAMQNYKKYIQHALSCKIVEFLLVILAILIGGPLPFSIATLLVIDITTNLFLELALRSNKNNEKLTQFQKPRILKKKHLLPIIINGCFLTVIVAGIYLVNLLRNGWSLSSGSIELNSDLHLQTITTTFLIVSLIQIVNAFNISSPKKSLIFYGFLRNPYLILTTIVSVLVTYILIDFPLFHKILSLTELNTLDWQIIIFTAITVFILQEVKKLITKPHPQA